ncbi:radical SAM protein [Candidatus Woesearchaeota archaeon]|nr:radical SAM protein [Candidatus Woesearchaeota archaeon]
MNFTILDCYTDEPAGLGVPPYIGTYPRYIAGAILETNNKVNYLTIDDLRFYSKNTLIFNNIEKINSKIIDIQKQIKTNIKIKNLSKNIKDIKKLLENTDILIIIAGIHTPGKYLSALPGTTKEVSSLLKSINYKKFTVLTGPAAHSGSGLFGGKIAREIERDFKNFNLIVPDIEFKLNDLIKNNFTEDISKEYTYKDLKGIAISGAKIVKQHPDFPDFIIAEIESSRGCPRKQGCSFCTEPLKYCTIERRPVKDIIDEVKALNKQGVKHFRLGKQTCFYSYGTADELKTLLKGVKKYATTLHIDNVNPAAVTEEKTKVIVKYCTPGNIAAFGVESFDTAVVSANNLNSEPETTYNAIKLINKYGAERGDNGLPKFLPGINILFGLINESKQTHKENMKWLKKILDNNLLVRRINIRQVVAFPGTLLYNECKDKFIKKNKKYYWKWRNEIRQNIDFPMLKKLVPEGTILKNLRTEIYDGNTTFARQIGTYPLIVGIKGRLPLNQFVDVKITGHMLRSVVGEVV